MANGFNVSGSYRQSVTSGAVTTIAAGTSTAGHILALRVPTSNPLQIRLRHFEAEFVLTTAFGAAQRVGFDASIARAYTAAHTGATALDFTGTTGRRATAGMPAATLTGRIANTGALTAGTHTIDTNPICSSSVWAAAVGAAIYGSYDFSTKTLGGLILAADEGLIIRNTVLMGATGVGLWHFSFDWDEGTVA